LTKRLFRPGLRMDGLVQRGALIDLCHHAFLRGVGDHLPASDAGLEHTVERISVAMVWRIFYHYSRAAHRRESDNLMSFLVAPEKLLGLVKGWHKQHRWRQHLSCLTWAILKVCPMIRKSVAYMLTKQCIGGMAHLQRPKTNLP
jgi:hypothetical protein